MGVMIQKQKIVYLGFGSNQGRKKSQIEKALRLLSGTPGIRLGRVSSLYRTEPVGGPSQPDHFNGVAELSVSLGPQKLLRELKRIERESGRRPGPRWGPRPLDLDILTYGKRIIRQSKLFVPHPLYHRRRFVMVPFAELTPRFLHPV